MPTSPTLIESRRRAIDGIDRIRYTTSHPVEVTDTLVARPRRGAGAGRVTCTCRCRAAATTMLERMKRLHGGGGLPRHRRAAARAVPARTLSLSSDFIVGFPGETEDEFEATMTLVEALGFDTLFQLRLQPTRPGTPATDSGRRRCPWRVQEGTPGATAGAHPRRRRRAYRRRPW